MQQLKGNFGGSKVAAPGAAPPSATGTGDARSVLLSDVVDVVLEDHWTRSQDRQGGAVSWGGGNLAFSLCLEKFVLPHS